MIQFEASAGENMTMTDQEKRRLLRAMDEDPQFMEAVRSRLLSRELMLLPERFASFVDHVTTFMEAQLQHNALVDSRLDTMDDRLQRITDDLGDLKGHVAGRIARERADDIAEEMGFTLLHELNGQDLRALLREHNPTDIAPGERQSFYRADLVARVATPDGLPMLIAAEASYTADARDVRRAVRNAQYLTRFYGIDAVPMIASRHNDHETEQAVADGTVRWFQLDQRDFDPE